jgi:hypothetical protein
LTEAVFEPQGRQEFQKDVSANTLYRNGDHILPVNPLIPLRTLRLCGVERLFPGHTLASVEGN